MRRNNIILIGPLPPPVGGVSTHIERLSQHFQDQCEYIIDLYPGVEKRISSDVHKVSRRKGWIYKLYFLARWLLNAKARIAHFHFSTYGSLLLLTCLPKLRKKWVLTLHHGALSDGNKVLSFLKLFALNRVDVIIAISHSQEIFYKRKNISSKKIKRLSSYLPPVFNNDGKVPEQFSNIKSAFSNVILANGYVTKIYRHDFLIALARRRPDVAVVLVIYGEFEKKCYEQVYEASRELDNFFIQSSVPNQDFLSMLKLCDCYVRPNAVDSYGLAVADACSLSVPVVASDVCERHPGAILFESGNFEQFDSKVEQALKKHDSWVGNTKQTNILAYTQLYKDIDISVIEPVLRS